MNLAVPTYRVASLFSGCGGLDLGFAQENYHITWANDIDFDACATYRRNIGNHVVCGDITDLDLATIPNVDVVVGGFPCQDFSMIWKRHGIETERGNLYLFLKNTVALKQPKIFLAENVKGLLSANKGEAIKTIIHDFSTIGYNTSFKVLNFADYGVPQLRERLIIVGTRKDQPNTYSFPAPTHSKENYTTAELALHGVEHVVFNNEHQNIKEKTKHILTLIPEGGNFSSIPKDSPYYVKGMISHVYKRLDRNKPSTTIIAAGGGGTWGYHYIENRPLTNRERARLFGYPDGFVFEGTISSVRKQIGNSVPPPAAKILAASIKQFLSQNTA